MIGMTWRHRLAGLMLAGLVPGFCVATTLYQWVDKSGETRFGYRPPPGVVGTVVGQRIGQSGQVASPVNCRELQQENLRLVDQEIARVRNLSAGFGTTFEFTPEAKQRFVNDLLILRSALVTGRPAEDFSPPDNRQQVTDMQKKYQKDKSQLMDELQTQSQQIQQQRREIERQRMENQLNMQRFWLFRPGFGFFPY